MGSDLGWGNGQAGPCMGAAGNLGRSRVVHGVGVGGLVVNFLYQMSLSLTSMSRVVYMSSVSS